MRFTQHTSNNGVLGAPPGWDQKELPCGALPITRTEIDGHAVMVSFWKPDAEELAALNRGDSISLWIYGAQHPVVAMGVTA
jgi:hypothetical protein